MLTTSFPCSLFCLCACGLCSQPAFMQQTMPNSDRQTDEDRAAVFFWNHYHIVASWLHQMLVLFRFQCCIQSVIRCHWQQKWSFVLRYFLSNMLWGFFFLNMRTEEQFNRAPLKLLVKLPKKITRLFVFIFTIGFSRMYLWPLRLYLL